MTIIKKEIINAGDEDQMTLSGYKRKQYSQILVKLGYLFTLGLMKLLFDLYPTLMVKCLCVKCNLEEADYVKLEDQYHQIYIEVVCCVLVNRNSMEIDLASKTNSCNTHDTGIEVDNSQQTVKDDKIQHKYFINKKIKYVWNEKLKCFEKLKGLHYGKSCSYFHECQGLTKSQQSERQLVYSSNAIKVSVTPILKLLYTQGLNPFYLFQAFSCTLWFIDMYYYFAGCILFLSVISLIIQIRQTRMTERKLKNTIGVPETVNVFRSDTQGYERISSEDLVPGDIIEIPQYGSIMQCDAVLLNGTCIVNESMLTGESVPVTKTSIPDPHHSTVPTKEVVFNDKDHVQHVLFCGTKIIQTRFYEQQKVTAVVMHTSFMTAKGELIRSILFPKPVSFKFTQDSYKFIACLALVAGIGMIYTLALMISRGETAKRVIVRTLDLITIVIPPALPAAMTVGIVMAQKRLWKSAIYCISPRNINLCGALDCFCFDKTGTLTEDGLDLKLVVPSTLARFQDEVHDIRSFSDTSLIIIAMATCHSLTLINNELAGDPLDLKMFEAIQWDFIEPGEDNSKYDNFAPTIVRPRNQATPLISSTANTSPQPQNIIEYGILRQFTFASKLQRMSVIVRRLGGSSFELFCKGSPEMVASLSLPESVPSNFQDTLMMYTRQGFRVLALAHRQLRMKIVKIQRCEREHVECKMTFLGLIVFENQLKMQTQPVIHILKNANIRSIMVTGDNMLTALSVAENCEMINKHDNIIFITSLPPENPGDGDGDEDNKYEIHWAHVKDNRPSIHLSNYEGSSEQMKHEEHLSPHHEIGKLHLAVTGKAWALIKKNNPQIIHQLLKYGTVFARFSPDLKQQLIEALIEYGHYVGMCGDGANDCGALKAAHAGISLSEAEASVASPFTSKQANIECVLSLIREGRAALVTSFGIFKFMACYSLTQFMSVCILYWVSANITDLSFLYIDLILLSTLGFTFSRTQASSSIVPRPPRVSLLALSPLLSIIIQLIINFSFQLSVWFFTIHQPWFEPYVAPPASIRNFTSHEVTAVFSISAFQYIILAIVFSKGAPYRKKIFTNSLFMLNIFLCFIITSLIVLYPIAAPWFLEAFQLKPAPVVSFRWLLMLLAFFNFLVSFFLEMTIIDWFLDKKDFGMRSNLKDMDTFNKSDVPENIMFNVSNDSSGFYNADVPHSVAVHKETDRRSVSLGHNIETQGDIEFQNIYEHRGSLTNFDDTNEINKLNVNNCNIIMDKNEQSVNSINLGYANLNDWLPEKNEHKNLSELMRAETILWERLEAIHKAHEAERCHIKLISSDEEDNSDDENVSKDANGIDQERKRDSNLPSRIRKLSDEIFRRLSSHHDDIQLIED